MMKVNVPSRIEIEVSNDCFHAQMTQYNFETLFNKRSPTIGHISHALALYESSKK